MQLNKFCESDLTLTTSLAVCMVWVCLTWHWLPFKPCAWCGCIWLDTDYLSSRVHGVGVSDLTLTTFQTVCLVYVYLTWHWLPLLDAVKFLGLLLLLIWALPLFIAQVRLLQEGYGSAAHHNNNAINNNNNNSDNISKSSASLDSGLAGVTWEESSGVVAARLEPDDTSACQAVNGTADASSPNADRFDGNDKAQGSC